jgi:hypothetical protein
MRRGATTGTPSVAAHASPRASQSSWRAVGHTSASATSQANHATPHCGRAVQIAEQPEHHAAQLHSRSEHQQHRDERRAGGPDHHADQQQRHRRLLRRREPVRPEQAPRQQEQHAAAASAPARHRSRRPTRQQQRAADLPSQSISSAPTSAAGQAEHVRIGERIARQQLHQRARERQRGAGAEAGKHARNADLPEDLRRRPPHPGRPAATPIRCGDGASASYDEQSQHRHRSNRQKPRPS